MKIFAVYNVKGGVGKTTSCVNLAYLSSLGQRTLLWDLDPQGASTLFLNEHPVEDVKAKKIVKDKKQFVSLIKLTRFRNLSLVPAFFNLRYMDQIIEDKKKSGKNLKKIFGKLSDQYKYVFIDCPPSISSLSEAIFELADCLLVPVIPTVLSLQSLGQIKRHISGNLDTSLQMLPFFSMVDRRKKLHLDLIKKEMAKKTLLESSIPYRATIEKMGVERAPLPHFAATSNETAEYQFLWKEILERASKK